jgi:hypothetical protein
VQDTNKLAFGNSSVTCSLYTDAMKDARIETALEWLSPGDISNADYDIRQKATDETGAWFLTSTEFTQWAKGEGSTVLFCPGKGIRLFNHADFSQPERGSQL